MQRVDSDKGASYTPVEFAASACTRSPIWGAAGGLERAVLGDGLPANGGATSDLAFDLAMARAHVAEFEARVEHHERKVAMLAEGGEHRAAEEAHRTLSEYRELLAFTRDHLRHLRKGLASTPGADEGEAATGRLPRVGAP